MFENLRRDAEKYADFGGWYCNAGFWIVAIYRFGMWAGQLPSLLRWPCWLAYRVLHLPYWLFNVHLWAGSRGARLGPGLCLVHPNNIYIGPGVEIGEDCLIHHEVTLGQGYIEGTPQLGDRVILFPGTRLLGGVRVGSDSMIGANCVVVKHVPAGSIVMPPTNRVLPRSLSPRAREQDRSSIQPSEPMESQSGHG